MEQEVHQLESQFQMEQFIHQAPGQDIVVKSIDDELKEHELKSQEFEKSLKDASELSKDKTYNDWLTPNQS